jgi:hypothetical protein
MKNTFTGSARSILAAIFLAIIIGGPIGAVCSIILPFIGGATVPLIGGVIATLNLI